MNFQSRGLVGLASASCLALAMAGVIGCTKGGGTGPGQPLATAVLFLVQPASVDSGKIISPPVQVAVVDSQGHVVAGTNPITVALATNPNGATLSGTTTVSAVNGVANFSDLRVNRSGLGYSLRATSGQLSPATSANFVINAPVPPGTWSLLAAGGVEDSIAHGKGHTCGIYGGNTYCWGANANGQLGIGNTSQKTGPTRVAGTQTFVKVSAGGLHTCGLTSSGAAYCWGANHYGQLGNGSTTDANAPVAVSGSISFVSISAGWISTCGVATSGAGYCWGYNGDGEIGDGSYTNKLIPSAIAGAHAWLQVSAGGAHSCGIDTSHTAYCWGYDGNGELGDGNFGGNQTAPVKVAGGMTWSSIATAHFFTCALTTAGAPYCWGWNVDGTLGIGTFGQPANTPSKVLGDLTFQSITSAEEHTCGLTASGEMWCWGYQCAGQLGNGTIGDQPRPTLVLGGLQFKGASVGGIHTCGLTATGEAYCWGYNPDGEVGNGTTTTPQTVPVKVVGP